MPQLDFSIFPSQLFWLAVSFFLMLFIFSHFIIPKTAEMINLRKNKIDGYLEDAAKLKVKVEQTLEKYNQALEQATREAKTSLETTQKEMDAMVERRQAELADALKKQVAEGEAKISNAREKALKKIDETAMDLASSVLLKLNFANVNDADIKEIMEHVKDNQNGNRK